MNIEPQEILAEINRTFPKEFQICVQAIQIRKLQQSLDPGTMDEVDDEA